MNKYPPLIEECDDPMIRTKAMKIFRTGSDKVRASLIRKLDKRQQAIRKQKEDESMDERYGDWEHFLNVNFKYLSPAKVAHLGTHTTGNQSTFISPTPPPPPVPPGSVPRPSIRPSQATTTTTTTTTTAPATTTTTTTTTPDPSPFQTDGGHSRRRRIDGRTSAFSD